MLTYAFLGAALGFGLGYFFTKHTDLFHIEKVQLTVALTIAGLILIPLLATVINRTIPISAQDNVANVQRIDGFNQSRFGSLEDIEKYDGVFIYALLEGKPIRMAFDPEIDLGGLEKGSDLAVKVKQGLLGLRWVEMQH